MHGMIRYQAAKKATFISIFINLFLSIIKVFFGIAGHSQGLFADGLNSTSDVFTDFFILFAAKAGSAAPDKNHPYGHRRIETLMTIILAIILITVSIGIIYDAAYKATLSSVFTRPSLVTPFVALFSILANELVYRYMIVVGKKIHSNLLQANAWHHRSDALSSIIVLAGVIGARFGIHYLDAAAAVLVALLIIKVAIKMAWHCFQELIDASISEDELNTIKKDILSVSGVRSIQQLRSRVSGGLIYLEIHLLVDTYISVSEGHFIGMNVSKFLYDHRSNIADVTIHIDPEDTTQLNSTTNPLDRKTIEDQLNSLWKGLPGFEERIKTNLHYLSSGVEIELILPYKILENPLSYPEIFKAYFDKIRTNQAIKKLDLYFG